MDADIADLEPGKASGPHGILLSCQGHGSLYSRQKASKSPGLSRRSSSLCRTSMGASRRALLRRLLSPEPDHRHRDIQEGIVNRPSLSPEGPENASSQGFGADPRSNHPSGYSSHRMLISITGTLQNRPGPGHFIHDHLLWREQVISFRKRNNGLEIPKRTGINVAANSTRYSSQ